VDFVVFTRCPELLQCSDFCLLGGGGSGGGSAVLLGSREVVGGRSISVLERINPSCSGGEESLSPGVEVVEQV